MGKLSPGWMKGLLTLALTRHTSERPAWASLVPAPRVCLPGCHWDTRGEGCPVRQSPHRIILNLMSYDQCVFDTFSWKLEMAFCGNERNLSWLDLVESCLGNYLKIPISVAWGDDERALFSCLFEPEICCSCQVCWDVCEAKGGTIVVCIAGI